MCKWSWVSTIGMGTQTDRKTRLLLTSQCHQSIHNLWDQWEENAEILIYNIWLFKQKQKQSNTKQKQWFSFYWVKTEFHKISINLHLEEASFLMHTHEFLLSILPPQPPEQKWNLFEYPPLPRASQDTQGKLTRSSRSPEYQGMG